MLKITIVSILIIHGIIHLLGFVKAFNYAEIKELKLPISKRLGILWFLVFSLCIIAAILYMFDLEYGWKLILLATISSQGIIMTSWQDAKYGTAINIVIISLLSLTILL